MPRGLTNIQFETTVLLIIITTESLPCPRIRKALASAASDSARLCPRPSKRAPRPTYPPRQSRRHYEGGVVALNFGQYTSGLPAPSRRCHSTLNLARLDGGCASLAELFRVSAAAAASTASLTYLLCAGVKVGPRRAQQPARSTGARFGQALLKAGTEASAVRLRLLVMALIGAPPCAKLNDLVVRQEQRSAHNRRQRPTRGNKKQQQQQQHEKLGPRSAGSTKASSA